MLNLVIQKYTIGLSLMLSLYWLVNYLVLIPNKHKFSDVTNTLVRLAVLYIPGLILLYLFINGLPMPVHQETNMGFGDYFMLWIAQFFAVAIIIPLSAVDLKLGLISDKHKGEEYKTLAQSLIVIILVPFLEELVARKLLGDHLANLRTNVYLCLSAAVFGLMHLQTGRIAIPLAMVYTGFVWAVVYMSSSSLLLATFYHASFNFFVGYIPQVLQNKSGLKAKSLYMLALLALGIIGFVSLVITTLNIQYILPAHHSLANGISIVFSNWGTWLLAAVCIISFVAKRKYISKELENIKENAD